MDTYEKIYNFLIERSALPRIEREGGTDWVSTPGADTSDPDAVRSMRRRRSELAKHLKDIRAGKKQPSQETHDPDRGEDRAGPGGEGTGQRTHAQAAGDIVSDMLDSRGREAEFNRGDWEQRIAKREIQASRASKRDWRTRSLPKPR